MTLGALALILAAAGLHAWWNLAAKRARSGLPFVSAVGLVIAPLYVVVAVGYVGWWRPTFDGPATWIILVSGILKTGYALFLQRAYARGDFSIVYPLARGTGPLLAVTVAMLVLGERPTLLAGAGIVCIVASIYGLTGGHRLLHPDRTHLRAGVLYGLGTGAFIAAYTVWDAHAVADRGIPPVLLDAGTAWASLLLLAPFTWKRRREVAAVWIAHRREVLTVALLSPVAYVLVLTAMSFTPVSYVAPAREVSMLFAALLGARLLGERDLRPRLLAAAGMAIGVALLTLG